VSWAAKHRATVKSGCFECVTPLADELLVQVGAGDGPAIYSAKGKRRPLVGARGGYSCAVGSDALYTLSCERVDGEICSAVTLFSRDERVLAQRLAQPGYRWGGIRLSPDEQRLAAFFDDGGLVMFDRELAVVAKRKLKAGVGETIGAIAWVGDKLAVGKDDQLLLLSASTLKTSRSAPHERVTGIATGPQGAWFVAVSNGAIAFYDDALEPLATLETHADRVWVSPSGRHVLFSRFTKAPKGLFHLDLGVAPQWDALPKAKKVTCEGSGNILYGCFVDDERFIVGFPQTMDELCWSEPAPSAKKKR
jgi:hypothetical protein